MAGQVADEVGALWPEPGTETPNRRFGDYLLGRQIGAGGMGVVYEAQQVSRNRKVALKLIRDEQWASPRLLSRFTIEAEAVARLDHPNIVRVHEAGECNGHPFFSMDLIAGESLGAKLAKGEFPLDWKLAPNDPAESRQRLEAVARLMAKTARAVHHAHERGVLHRDLKPGNILIDQQGEPHLTDFGLAKILQPTMDEHTPILTTPGDLPGTPNYMSPEQVSGAEATRASDIYGLGALLYELLTGRPPFGGHTPLETFRQIADQSPTRPQALNPSTHADLETICLKCLEKDPQQRYISAAAVADDLENWLAGRPIKACPPPMVYRLRRWIRRNPIGTALIGSLCLGLGVALALLMIVNAQRKAIERDQAQTFEEGMNKISLLWQDRAKREVEISAREMAILAGRSPGDVSQARYQLCFGVSTESTPSSIAQRYARLLGHLQEEMEKTLGESVVFSLKLFKQFNEDEESLARAEADLMVLSAVDYLRAESLAPGVTPIAREKFVRDAVIFAHTNSGVQRLVQLAGKSVAFPDPDLSVTIWAKARLAAAGVRATDLRAWTNIVDQGAETGQAVVSLLETVNAVLKHEADAAATYRDRFERYKYHGLVELESFPATPNVLAARKGLDPRIIEALYRAIPLLEGKAGFDSLSVDLPGEMVRVDEAYFAPLREALRQAERFEGRGELAR